MAQKRIKKEVDELTKVTFESDGFLYIPDEKDIFEGIATILGPPDTPYEGGLFKIRIQFPSDYPFKPMKLKFITRIYHPNIKFYDDAISEGILCCCNMQELFDQWSPAFTLKKILTKIKELFITPVTFTECMEPIDIFNEYVNNPEKFKLNAIEWKNKYAI